MREYYRVFCGDCSAAVLSSYITLWFV